MIELAHASVVCPHFAQGGVEFERTAIIGTIRIFEVIKDNGDKVYDLVIGCNWFRNCENVGCGYSWVSRQESKKRKEHEIGRKEVE